MFNAPTLENVTHQMIITKMKQKELAEKVALLKDGVTVEIDGLSFKAYRIDDRDRQNPCSLCNVDCLCRGDIAEVCTELDFMSKSSWYLHLVDNF